MVLVGGSIAVTLVCRRWPLLWNLIDTKTLPACPACGEDVDRHRGILVSRHRWRIQMMPFLILTRAAIISWTTIAVLPLELAFDAVESELKRRGVEL